MVQPESMTAEGERAIEELSRARLVGIVRSTLWLHEALRIVREVGPPGGFVAAGAVRDTVWDVLTGRQPTAPQGDVDVVYWADEHGEDAAGLHERHLRAARPDLDWEVTNQATIHLWHRTRGQLVARHASVDEGVATWPETATAVGVRLAGDDTVEVLAPLGLADLFALRLRQNPSQTGVDVFWKRVTAKRWMERWPELKMVGPLRDA